MSAQYCTYCGKDHPTALCPHSYGGSAQRANQWCSYCGSNKHTADYCLMTYSGSGNRRRDPSGTFLD